MGEAKRRKKLDPNYGRQSEILVQTLLSEGFHEYIKNTLYGMTQDFYEPIIKKLVSFANQGLKDKWLGLNLPGIEFRIGYENGQDCYTMIIQDGVGRCFNYGKEAQIVVPASPDKLSFTRIDDFLKRQV